MVEGGCLCGGVRFGIERAVGPFELCHCRRCRKASGSAFAAFLGVEKADYRLLAGAELIARYDAPILEAPPAYRASFCRRCGSPVPDPDPTAVWFEIPAGLLDGDPIARPDKHIFVEHRAPWYEICDALPKLTKQELVAWRQRHGRGPRASLSYRELETRRLRLRRPRTSDATLIFAFGSDPEVMRFLTWRPHPSLADAEAAVASRLRRLEEGVEYSWILEPLASGASVGIISAWFEAGAVELGFALAQPFWSQGLMTEATQAIRGWAFEAGAQRVWATCDLENLASARVLAKAGLERRGLFGRVIVRPNLEPSPRPSLLFSVER